MKGMPGYLLVLAVLLFAGADLPHDEDPPAGSSLPQPFPMCSGEPPPGTCTGSVYCTACKNCKYCGHCNRGGSCGVCGKRPARSSSKPEAETVRKPHPSPPEKNDRPATDAGEVKLEEIKNTAAPTARIYLVIQETSLRALAHSQATVLKRLQVGEAVVVVESSGEFWWQVVQSGRTGWVKKHLLKEKVQRIYP